jgi:ArsR family transcriptional regulator
MTSCRYLSIEVSGAVPESDDGDATDLPELAETLQELEQLENELSLAQRFVQGRLAAVRERIADAIADTNPRLVTELLAALAEDDLETEALSKRVEAPAEVIEDVLAKLESEDVVTRESDGWHLGDL